MAFKTSTSSQFITLLLFFFFTLIVHPSHSAVDTFVYGGCSEHKYTPLSPYESNLNNLLTSMVNSATYSSYNKFTILGSAPQYLVYGMYQCRGDLSMPECAHCVGRAVTRFGSQCLQNCGGSVQLQGCFVKYDNVSFLGVEDKTVLLKKCGPSNGYSTEDMQLRDAVLGGLGNGGGPYRVGGSGKVEGVAQCNGDLSVGQCQDCVYEAIGRLKGDCGTAVYGDMFLGTCYARYTTGGAPMYSSNNGKSGDNSTKAFAIIVGLLGAIALLIIFLTFIKNLSGGGGK